MIDLPDWPACDKPDGYLRIRNGGGFAFFFNSTDREASIELPLDTRADLNGGEPYAVRQLYPVSKNRTNFCRDATTIDLAPHSAYLFEIRPHA